MNSQLTPARAVHLAGNAGFGTVMIAPGLFLTSRDNLQDIQQNGCLPPEEGFMQFDFSGAPYWITGSGVDPVAVADEHNPTLIRLLQCSLEAPATAVPSRRLRR